MPSESLREAFLAITGRDPSESDLTRLRAAVAAEGTPVYRAGNSGRLHLRRNHASTHAAWQRGNPPVRSGRIIWDD